MNKKIFILLSVIFLLGGCRLYEIETPPPHPFSGSSGSDENTMYISYLGNDDTVTINSTRTNHNTTTWDGTWFILNKQVLLE